MTIHDLSPPITPDLAVFPGDTPVSREVLMDMKAGAPLTLSTLRATVHLGAHVDAANHYDRDGAGVEAWPLDLFLGACQVMRVDAARGRPVTRQDLPGPITAERVLLHTGTFPDPGHWNDDFAWLAPDLVDHLADAGVRLVGVDTPSVDAGTAKTLTTHDRFRARGVAILEGIVLTGVPDGMYELIALPLRLVGFDASPVRAVLRGQ